jgi:hypothetical protein
LPTYLKIPDGFSVFSAWFAQHGLQAKVSDAGRVAEQILASLEGIEGGWALANKEVVSLLNEMAQGLAEATPIDESSQSERKPIPRGRAVPRERWLELLGKLYQDNGRAKRHLDFLLTHGVLKIGARVECPRCRQANWYPLDDMGEELRCERCLRYYAFPAVEPPKNLWYYRTNGPFSIESYARGSYSAVLALRALSGRFGRRAMTWATGIQIGAGDAKDLEADFVVWQRDLWLGQIKSWLIFGEAKSFADGAFKPKDIERAKALAKQFPGAVLVFATMRTELNAEEKKRLSKLALWGRYGIGNDRTRAPVLILTATELFANAPPPGCWVGHGERFQPFVNAFGVRGSLPQLCNATQQLHLDMESYGVWSQRYWERRHRRRAARNKALADA